jgi:hypothetical protein
MTADHAASAAPHPFPPHPHPEPVAPRGGVDPLGAVAVGVAALQVLVGIVLPFAGSRLYGPLGFFGYAVLSNAATIGLAAVAVTLGLVAVLRARRRGRRALLGWAGLGVGALGLVQVLGSLAILPLLYLPY